MARVLLAGYGEMGHAMERLLAPTHAVDIWTRRAQPGQTRTDLASAAAAADYVVACTPAPALAQLAQTIVTGAGSGTCVVTMAKGLDDAGRIPARILAESGITRLVVLYGPMIAEEILAGRPAWALVAGQPAASVDGVRALFAHTGLHLGISTDVPGLSWCAVLKNIYAILLGASDGLRLGDNARGWLLTRATDEMGRALASLGGDPASAHGLAGLGDLVTTATSPGSHHRAVGAALARGEPTEPAGEGVHAAAVLCEHALLDPAAFPLVALAGRLLREPARAAGRLRAFVESGGNG